MSYTQVAYEKKGNKCSKVLKCKTVDEQEYNKMLNESLECNEEELNKHYLLVKRIEELEHDIVELKHEIKVLKGEEE